MATEPRADGLRQHQGMEPAVILKSKSVILVAAAVVVRTYKIHSLIYLLLKVSITGSDIIISLTTNGIRSACRVKATDRQKEHDE